MPETGPRRNGSRCERAPKRTIGWLTTNRRLAKDYERLVETGEMLLYLAMSRILLRRLTRKQES
jgi:putative transposase